MNKIYYYYCCAAAVIKDLTDIPTDQQMTLTASRLSGSNGSSNKHTAKDMTPSVTISSATLADLPPGNFMTWL